MSDKFGGAGILIFTPVCRSCVTACGIHRRAQRLEQAAWELTATRGKPSNSGPLVRGLPHLCAISSPALSRDIFDWRTTA